VTRLITLDEPAATDASRVGFKAAGLAAAKRHGFSVLPGVIVPIDASSRAVEAGARALEDAGVGPARRAVDTLPIEAGLVAALKAALPFSGPLIVRSSTTLDDSGRFAGAFASVADVWPDELPTAVRGCWASIFAPDAVRRLKREGRSVGDVGMAVLIQPLLRPIAGGWARLSDDVVEVASISGSPAPLLSGAVRGLRYRVDRDVTTPPPGIGDHPLTVGVFERVDALLRLVHDELGVDSIEWADDGSSLVLLQVQRTTDHGQPSTGSASTLSSVPATFAGATYRRFARTLLGRAGRLAERYIVPWAAAAPHEIRSVPVDGDPSDLLDAAGRWATELAADLSARSGIPTGILLERLSQGDLTLDRAVADVTLDPTTVGRLIGAFDEIGSAMVAAQILEDPSEIWWQHPSWVEAAVASRPHRPATAWVPDRWTDLLFGVVTHNGAVRHGQAASGGRASGRAVLVERPDDAGAVRARDILVVNHPRPEFAPLLWTVAGVVSRDGDAAAHLFEVARSRRIPAVAGIGESPVRVGDAMAIHGDAGESWTWSTVVGARAGTP
jgi:phosphohistidine swiveling domain-containing protein